MELNISIQSVAPHSRDAREGAIYQCFKHVKKLFRQVCRRNRQALQEHTFSDISSLYRGRKMSALWNTIRRQLQKKRVNSALSAQQIADFFSGTMQDKHTLSTDHQQISDTVRSRFHENSKKQFDDCVTPETVSRLIKALNRGSSPGCDGITGEHMMNGRSQELCEHLASV
jgi:hypothetical protein